jgi:hypothetical protein
MTKKNKLIVGAVVLLGAYYLYNKNKVKNEVEDLKEGADYPAPPPPLAEPTKVLNESKVVNVIDAKNRDNFERQHPNS